LTSAEAARLLALSGPNALRDVAPSVAGMAIAKLWAPIPWMLESAMLLQLVLGKYVESGVIAILLLFNAALGFIQEWRSRATLTALRSRLALTASVRRDGSWVQRPAAMLVVGDIVTLSLGGVVPADVTLITGNVLIDQSMLTGESIGTEAGPGFQTFAGALVRRGEAVARVTATGNHTKFGKTAELIRTAHVVSSQQVAVLRVVRNLAIFNGMLIVLIVIYAVTHAMPAREIIPLVLTAILASIPVALPATFTLAGALGARALARQGVLPTRLSAVDEAATIDVLCADKTGTLTRNQLSVAKVVALPGSDEPHVLAMAALASSDGGQDPVDGAIHAAAAHAVAANPLKVLSFVPFDPAQRISQATVADPALGTLRIVKGACAAVSALALPEATAGAAAHDLESQGFRVLAVAAGPVGALRILGLIALSDPPRDDSGALIRELSTLGIRTVMVTGDAPTTAVIVARAVGIAGLPFPPGPIPDALRPEDYGIFAGVLPADKYRLVKSFQQSGHAVGMCGDGANDAPALRQAQIGIAVSTATDVAKSAAGVVLTDPGLAGIVAAVKEGRITFQRILTYALNSVTKKIVQVLLLGVGLLMTGHAVLTPLLMIIVMMAGDLLGMSLTTDNVRPSPLPNRWLIGSLTIAGLCMGVGELAFCVGVIAYGHFHLRLDTGSLQTLAFVTLVCANQASTYAIRARGWIWSRPHPSRWLVASTIADLTIALVLATCGWLMTSLPVMLALQVLLGAILFAFVLDLVKKIVFVRLKMS
jgi:H+-transporting ATPase